ncbi:hypothetical protein QUF94_08860 [Peribacillus sp. NJ4]|uniref:hypothetical protein n=1 Tax=Peribacillus sp. NJ4 TaxID=3055862 RepID=UPI0025A27954|nr:hypothetical protein [Peribacillus sp. NJ4]MDM5211549.1 hypothetical protein [Peribacillus sp. NJ4]
MPGFIGYIGKSMEDLYFPESANVRESNLLFNEAKDDNYHFENRVNKKFQNDKIFYENEKYIIITDGILLNSKQLINRYKSENLVETIIKMYEYKGEQFFNEIRGSYSCILFDKKSEKWLIFTDQLGDKKVYFSEVSEGYIIGSRVNDIATVFKANKKPLTLSEDSSLFMLTFGFMIDDNTMVNEIKRLLPGHYLKIENNDLRIIEYFQFDNEPIIQGTEDEIIDQLDQLFRESVKLQFEKDKEYGYKHLASISGGLDSRMVNVVANDLGYKDILNYTFSQSNYLDEKIAKQIAVDLNHEFIFKSLDDAKFLLDIDSIVKINGGTSIYYGLAHSKNNLDSLNLEPYGLVHTGQIGDVVVGSFSKSSQHESVDFSNYVYSTKYQYLLKNIAFDDYENDELFKMYNRGFNFALNGNLSFQERTESFSPFCNVEFMQFCLNIPLHFRINHNLYYKWILKKYPSAANYKYERIKSKITTPKLVVRSMNFTFRCINKALNILKLPTLYGYNTKRGMNPFDYWYRQNHEFKKFIDKYYEKNIVLLDGNKDVQEKCKHMFKTGITVEKIQVLTILSTAKVILGEE